MNRLAVASLLFGIPAVAVAYSYVESRPPPEYITATVERGSIASVVKASGSVEAVLSVDVSSQLSGRVAEVLVDFNDRVTAGQPLARLDQGLFAAHVNGARAALMVSQANLQVAEAAVERAKTAVDNARTAHRISEAQLAAVQADKAKQNENFSERRI